jgi:hypothetical protein
LDLRGDTDSFPTYSQKHITRIQQHKSLSEYLATAMFGEKREEFDIANYRSLAIVNEVTEESHIDKDDVCNTACLITILGDFKRGELEFLILGVRFRMRPGDIAIFQSHLLYHKTSSIKEDVGTSLLFYSPIKISSILLLH